MTVFETEARSGFTARELKILKMVQAGFSGQIVVQMTGADAVEREDILRRALREGVVAR